MTHRRAIHYEIDCTPALLGHFDVALIERVLHNLIGNRSARATRRGVVRIPARPWDPADPTSCELTVLHTGPCVPESLRPEMFAITRRTCAASRPASCG